MVGTSVNFRLIHIQHNQCFVTFPYPEGPSRIAKPRQAICYSPNTLMKHLEVLTCVFLSASVSLRAGNLVQNPGFETTGSWSTSGGAAKVYGNAHTGSYSMRATAGNNGAWQQISVTPHTTYTLTVWGKKDSSLTNLMIFVKDYGGSAIGQYFTSTSYGQKSITFTPTGTSCVIGVWAWNGTGYGYGDDFALSAIQPTPTLSRPSNVIYLVWQAPPTPPLLSGYFVYRGPAPGSYNFKESVGNVLSWHSQPLLPGTYYFSTTAFDGTHESAYSNEVSAVVQ